MTEAEMIEWISNADIEALLYRWRFEAYGSPWFTSAVGDHYSATIAKRREEVGPDAWANASKAVGWDR